MKRTRFEEFRETVQALIREAWEHGLNAESIDDYAFCDCAARADTAIEEVFPAGVLPPSSNEAFCDDCGGPNVVWFTDSSLWNHVVRQNLEAGDPMLCPRCFALRAEKAGIKPTGWKLVQEEGAQR